MSILLTIVLACVLAACAATPEVVTPTATTLPREAVLALPQLLAAPQQWSGQRIILISPVDAGANTQRLAVRSDAPPQAALWLAQPLPDRIKQQLRGGGVIKARGTLSPPGAYGRDQAFLYQFTPENVSVIEPERTTIANLALNPRALDRVLLRLDGTLLAEGDAALLVDEASATGVPSANAHQIKLARASLPAATFDQLKTQGDVRWGRVELVGWWQDGQLVPLSAAVQAPR